MEDIKNSELRLKAIARLKQIKTDTEENYAREDLITLVQELQIHQIELEIQNEELRRSGMENEELKSKYFELYELAPAGYFTLDKKGIILELNLTAAMFFNKDKSLMLGSNFINFIEASSQKDFMKFIDKAFNSQIKQTAVFKIRNDAIQYIQVNAIPIENSIGDAAKDAANDAAGGTGRTYNKLWMTAADITKNILSEMALGESEEKYRSLFNYMTEGFALAGIILDYKGKPVDYRLIEVNKTWEKINGMLQEDIAGKTAKELNYNCEPESINIFGKVALTGEPACFEQISKNKDKWLEINVYSTKKGYFACILNDITERKRIENEIIVNDKRLESLLKLSQHQKISIPELLDKTLEEAVALTNSSIGYIYTYDEVIKEFTLNSWSKNVMNECTIVEKQTVYKLENTGIWGEAVRQAKPVIINDFTAPHPLKKGYPEGHTQLLKFLTIPFFNEGQIVGVIGVANKQTDYNDADIRQLTLLMDSAWKIVERKKAEKEMKKAKESAEKANRVKNQFISNLSHELRTPLNSILGYAQLLKKSANLNMNQHDNIEIIFKSGFRLLGMINDLLDLSKIEANKMELEKKSFRLPDFLFRVVEIIRCQAEEKNLTFTFDSTSDLPVNISGDENKLQQILLNLLSNAIKFTDGGKVILRVGIVKEKINIAFRNNIKIRFEVQDTGIGIKLEEQQIIFDSFQQLNINHTKSRGTGLGLTISRDLAKLMGSDLFVKSKPGKGSIFWFDVVFDILNDVYTPVTFGRYNKKNQAGLTAGEMAVPQAAELMTIYSLVKLGDIINIRKQIEKIEKEHPVTLQFVSKLKVLAKKIDLKGMESFLLEYIKEK